MQARCARCQTVFSVTGDGVQSCPSCGARLELKPEPRDPSIQFSSGAGEGGSSEPPGAPEKVPTPWERRSELGFFAGLFETIRLSVTQPSAFFGSMRTVGLKSAVSYAWLVGGLSGLAANLWFGLGSSLFQRSAMAFLDVPAGGAQALSELGIPMGAVYIIQGALLFLLYPLSLFTSAALYHAMAMLLGAAKNGFSATLRAVAYSCAPMLLALVIPCVGVTLGQLGQLVLIAIGLSKLQETTAGRALSIVLLPMVLCCCFALLGLGAVFFALGMTEGLAQMVEAMGQ